MNLPPEFIGTVHNTFGAEGRAFLKGLPALIADASRRWSLSEVQAVPNLSYNFVAFARRGTEEVVLKIGVPNRELRSETAALRLFDGRGAARLLESDEARGLVLLERLRPGRMLSTLEDDEQASHIAAGVMLSIWRPVLSNAALIQLADWFKGFERMRARFGGGTGPLDERLVERAEGAARDLLTENHTPRLIHGDLHHFNILADGERWLGIDPKGVIGPAAYEAGPLLLNPWTEPLEEDQFKARTRKRIDILHERLGFERERIRAWGLAHAVLSAWWGIEDNTGWEYALRCARLLDSIK